MIDFVPCNFSILVTWWFLVKIIKSSSSGCHAIIKLTSSGALPPTAYVKMIDVWLIFSQSIPFFEVCLQTFIDSMREDGKYLYISDCLSGCLFVCLFVGMSNNYMNLLNNLPLSLFVQLGRNFFSFAFIILIFISWL